MTTQTDSANARSQLCQLLALGFSHPVEALHRVLQDGSYKQALVSAAAGAQCPCYLAQPEPGPFTDFEADYIHLFQVGRGGKPLISLNAGDHEAISQQQGRPELLLQYSDWYRHFGLKTSGADQSNELPDHLVCQLEFMAWLAHLECKAAREPELLQGYQRAQRDFLQRHLQPFMETLVAELGRQAGQSRAHPFYRNLAVWALEATGNILEQLDALATETSRAVTAADPDQIATVNLWG